MPGQGRTPGRLAVAGGVVLFLGAGTTVAIAAEYYSWIDRSGAMVITDDPQRIPPAKERIAFQRHRLPDPQETRKPDPEVRKSSSEGTGDQPGESLRGGQPAPQGQATGAGTPPGPDELPQILLDAPEHAVRPWYRYVPFTTPQYLPSGAVYGFWAHLDLSSPFAAFEELARGKQPQLGDPPLTGLVLFGLSSRGLSRHPGKDQVTNPVRLPGRHRVDSVKGAETGSARDNQARQGRQPLLQRTVPPFPPPSVTPRPSVHRLSPTTHDARGSTRSRP
ncbi:MAG: DUF4124 domain-containing protein [Nitrospirales bacterium]